MEARTKELKENGDKLFDKRHSLLSLWQEQADNFYPERADFTTTRNLGTDFASHLTTSYPVLARRTLGDAFSGMLRPKETAWFKLSTSREDLLDNSARAWLEWAGALQKNAMYDRNSLFIRATKEADHDFATFGQCAISVEFDAERQQLLYRCWHLRDVAWCEDYAGKINEVHRRWKPTARSLNIIFKGNISSSLQDKLEKDPYCEVDVRHVVVASENYNIAKGKKTSAPYVSVYFECDTGHVLEETPSYTLKYVIPRWQTVSGSQYAYSPATVAALPDARLIQAMTLVLLEAGQKSVDPPMVAVQEAIRSDVGLYSGGITWVDADYDERLGEVLRPISLDTRGIPLGIDLREDVKQMIADAFYISKITLPPVGGKEMTAYEVGQRVQQYIRDALPLFEPMELDYNGALCDITFETIMRVGGFGNMSEDLPQSLRGQEIKFKFESPLHEAIEKQKGQAFLESKGLLEAAFPLDKGVLGEINIRRAFRDTLNGIGTPASWLATDEERQAFNEKMEGEQKAQEMLALMQQGGAAAEQIGKAGQAMNEMNRGAA